MTRCDECGRELDPEKGEAFLTDDGGTFCADHWPLPTTLVVELSHGTRLPFLGGSDEDVKREALAALRQLSGRVSY